MKSVKVIIIVDEGGSMTLEWEGPVDKKGILALLKAATELVRQSSARNASAGSRGTGPGSGTAGIAMPRICGAGGPVTRSRSASCAGCS